MQGIRNEKVIAILTFLFLVSCNYLLRDLIF